MKQLSSVALIALFTLAACNSSPGPYYYFPDDTADAADTTGGETDIDDDTEDAADTDTTEDDGGDGEDGGDGDTGEVCVPDCNARSCGDDGCGGSCGGCPAGPYTWECSPEGICVAAPAETCEELNYCLTDLSTQAEMDACIAAASPEAVEVFYQLTNCISLACEGSTEAEWEWCLNNAMDAGGACEEEFFNCFPPVMLSCEEYSNCVSFCQSDEFCADYCDGSCDGWCVDECLEYCDFSTPQEEKDAWSAVGGCIQTNCPDTLSEEDYQACISRVITNECAEEVNACFPDGI